MQRISWSWARWCDLELKSCCSTDRDNKPCARLTIALVGNPNVGKSAFFSRLTGVGVEISNYPGTTVEIIKGTLKHVGESINVVDLPGIYSLSASTEDERAAMKYLIRERPDVVINIIDATRLARNLNLTLQLLEIDLPMVVALNQVDAAEQMGIKIDVEALEAELGVLAGTAVFIDVMTPLQIYIFALVATIYVPCAATIAVIGKELGWRNMVLISGFTIVLSIVVGGAANFLGLVLL